MDKDGAEEANSPSFSNMYKSSLNRAETERTISPLMEEARFNPSQTEDESGSIYKSSFFKQVGSTSGFFISTI